MRASWHIRILGTLKTVAMVIQKPSKSMDIATILMIFARYGCLIYINVYAKNEENLPSRFRDMSHSNSTATRFRLRIPRFSDVMDDIIMHVTSRDVMQRLCDVRRRLCEVSQIGANPPGGAPPLKRCAGMLCRIDPLF